MGNREPVKTTGKTRHHECVADSIENALSILTARTAHGDVNQKSTQGKTRHHECVASNIENALSIPKTRTAHGDVNQKATPTLPDYANTIPDASKNTGKKLAIERDS